MREALFQHLLELGDVHLASVPRVPEVAFVGEGLPVRGGDDEHAVLLQHPLRLREQIPGPLQLLQDLEGDKHVLRLRGQGKLREHGRLVAHVGRRVRRPGHPGGLGRARQAYHGPGAPGEQGRAGADLFPANVRHRLALDKPPGEGVAREEPVGVLCPPGFRVGGAEPAASALPPFNARPFCRSVGR